MANEPLIVEVGASGFDKYVIQNSHQLPVVVEFMAMWSGPCMAMADTLHDLATEFAGQFVFAKVDIDEQPELVEQFGVENVPALRVFNKGEVTFSEQGQFQEEELRMLLKGMGIFSRSEELREQARAKHMAGETSEAIVMMSQAIQMDPANTRVAMDMVQIFIDIGEMEQATGLFNKLPDSDKESEMSKSLTGQLTFADLASNTEGAEALQQRLSDNSDDLDARFDLAICHVAAHDYDSAIDQLFTVLQADPDYKNGAAKEMIITVTNMLDPNNAELAGKYRQRLASLLNG
ncbi:co-chaperone YbbN [Solemya pervernicosa gill symbiont]|uniref:Co-chaperone YbbN n=2 Tax=Gammaproteobacteria incertae sedis TaxID=118884 RepID=A0A1T2L2J3_9GAMM|nr:tetratricopeptide repeat protein [Candidatus Reidiella endopervernicosa]OOZ39291.1 co-chaperone YbbN [Solemya pervernicosa gill symbiont]QKQ25529.1 tetratricopeptide repeat protein [Candidatus Reidiella endopervernicosa]